VTFGLDTLLYSASATPVPDVVALAATAMNDGILHITGTTGSNAFAVATVNVGATAQITATANTGAATLPLAISLCQTNPMTGQCTSSIGPSVTTTINANATPTFAIFATVSGQVPFVPQTNRIFVGFSDATGTVRGSTSVAVQTQ
jgi:enamine deaminase RidA (YjgF/YER057c/UK114 family)